VDADEQPGETLAVDTVCDVSDSSQVVVGLRQNIAISTQGQDSTRRGFQRSEVLIAAILLANSLVVREGSFVVITGVTN
jgi:hypothetical protein